MTGFVPFVRGVVPVAVQHNACELHARLGTLVGHTKRACGAIGARLQQHELTASAKLHAGRSCKFLCPFLERLVRGFDSTNTSRQEKFLTIRWLLTGERSSGVNVSESFVGRLKQLFSRLQDPFTQIVKPCRAVGQKKRSLQALWLLLMASLCVGCKRQCALQNYRSNYCHFHVCLS